jgi:hypothetical protein
MYYRGMTKTMPRRSLPSASTAELISQYDLAISSYAGRLTEKAPRQQRINVIVDLLSNRADAGDTMAIAWLSPQ